MTCTSCGAAAPGIAQFCARCGHRTGFDSAARVGGEHFANARRTRGYETAMEAPVPRMKLGLTLAVFVLFIGIGIAMLVLKLGGDPRVTGGWPGLAGWFVVLGAFAWLELRVYVAPPRTRLACAVRRDTMRRQKGGSYQIAELEFEDGKRVTVKGDDALLDTVREGDLGVFATRADRLIAFHRLDG